VNLHTQRQSIAGPAGALECAIDAPGGEPRGVAVICHPHPQHGGTLDNKVAQTLARAAIQLGWRSVRFNFRGVGASQGTWDEGRGEIDDALAVIAAHRAPGVPLLLCGFSFGAYVASQAAVRLADDAKAQRLVLAVDAEAADAQRAGRHRGDPRRGRRGRTARGDIGLGAAAGVARDRVSRRGTLLPRPVGPAEEHARAPAARHGRVSARH
jgi:pimeloyl-ACP methyl ester carboxylesterase